MRDRERGLKPKITVMRFIMIWFVFLWLVFSALLLGMFGLLSRQLENYLIRKNNRDNMRYYERHLSIAEDGTVSMDEEDPLETGYYIVVQDLEGNHVLENCPEALRGYTIDRMSEGNVEIGGKRYVISCRTYDGHEGNKGRGQYVLCGIADPQYASTLLDDLRLPILGFMVVSLLLLVAVYLFMRRRIDLPLRQMSQDAAAISASRNFSEELRHESGFYEIDTLEQAYLQLYEKMAAVIESQDHFNSNVSHELRTPLTVIQAQCQVLRETAGRTGDEKLAEALDVIDRQTDKMKEMISILLRLSRLKSGDAVLELEEFDLVNVVEAVCEDDTVAEEDRKIVCDLQETIIRADVNLIIIAVRNLLSNALKYSGPGSEIRIRCGVGEGRPFCSVSDQGIGIRDESVGRIYDNFYRGEESRSSEGFGLGLSLTKRIMELHGGEITVDSRPGEGSTFTLLF